jgi:hypothetical protein
MNQNLKKKEREEIVPKIYLYYYFYFRSKKFSVICFFIIFICNVLILFEIKKCFSCFSFKKIN